MGLTSATEFTTFQDLVERMRFLLFPPARMASGTLDQKPAVTRAMVIPQVRRDYPATSTRAICCILPIGRPDGNAPAH